MVNERTTIQPECSRTLKDCGFTVDVTRDYLKCPYCYKPIYPDSATGRFDVVASFPISYGKTYWSAVEVKYGGSTRQPFNKISQDQRDWYHAKKEEDGYDSFWLWFCIGDRINGTSHPRRTFLIPFSLFLELENTLDRKSIPVDQEEIQEYELEWSGNGLWIIPEGHALWEDIDDKVLKVQGE